MTQDHSFPNAPNAGHDFQVAQNSLPQMEQLQEEEHVEEPSELVVERHLTPGGELDEVVHRELDTAARAAILAAQQRSQDGIDERDNPVSAEPENAGDDYEKRMRDQFNLSHQQELDRDH